MKQLYKYFLITIFIIVPAVNLSAQVTGLSGWNIFIDPGHSQNENVGIYNYSEAHKVLRVGLNLRQLLLDNTDIDTVYISRTNDQQQVSLTQRTDHANSVGAAWYHSIHSNAGAPAANNTLMLWGQYYNGLEKIPNGGKAMSDIMIDFLTAGYRIPTIGSIGDCSFYGTCSASFIGPYLHVNRESNMPSELSEAGFHTNPTQNQRNMSPLWKRLEAYTFYWSLLEYHEITRPFVGITTGIISNIEGGAPVNGAIVTVNGLSDTTDTYESLFHLYSNDPEQLRNGFYFIEGLPAGTHSITVEAEGYDPFSGDVTIQDTFFTFKDIQLVSNMPPYIVQTNPVQNDSIYPGEGSIGIMFSRPMDKASVEANLTLTPSASFNLTWSNNDRQVAISTTNLTYNTNYELTISGSAMDKYGHPFDGDGNGVGGDDFTLNFKTKIEDIIPPSVVDIYPPENEMNVELTPIINLSFNERINTTTLAGKVKLIRNSDQSEITGILKHYLVNNRSTVNLFVTNELEINEGYTVKLEPGLEDMYGNAISGSFTSEFTTGDVEFSLVSIVDNFENGITNWWEPQQSGSTTGIITELTSVSVDASTFNYIYGGSRSMKLTYGWDTLATTWLIREHRPAASPTFSNDYILQTYLFGDGNSNKFRFVVRETTSTFEASPWFDVDWIGWKLVSWDMVNDEIVAWVGGNGILTDQLRIDSYQLTYEEGNVNTGVYYFDDLRVVNKVTVGVNEELISGIPSDYVLQQNYPNPFNPSTQIRFGIPEQGLVKLEVYTLLGEKVKTLIDEELNSGYHSINFDAVDLASGIYIYTLSVNDFMTSRKMILMK
jgi:hypothetical protein